ncbi:MAG: hypothetical protein HY518_01475 [Candidatus Aenigmarchaeota archaeon]|nr:hypothetical protein [Candidatus Aenigmarchaeota archaeon]
MSGQIEPITLVIITGMVIALVGAAYVWGVPLIQKRTATTDFASAERFIIDLDKAIIDVANRGGGERSVVIPKGIVRMVPDISDPLDPQYADRNSAILEVSVDQPLVLDATVPIRTLFLGDVGKFGEAEPRVMELEVVREGTRYRMSLKAQYRELDTATAPLRGFRIRLNQVGNSIATDRVVVSYGGNVRGVAANGGELTITNINLELE